MTQLCFEVGNTNFSFAEINLSNKEILRSGHIDLNSRSVELKKEDILALLKQHDLTEFDGEVSLSFIGSKTTLVPQNIFGDTSAKAVFELCFGESDENIEHKRFYEQTLVNVYEIADWVKLLFVVRYPRIIIEHETTHVLRGIFNAPSFEPAIHIVPNNEHFSIFACSKNSIDFFNTFEFENAHDLLYYTMSAWNNSPYETKQVKLRWHQNQTDELLNDFQDLLKKVKKETEFEFQTVNKIKHQLLCV
jgi:hypothetical protein